MTGLTGCASMFPGIGDSSSLAYRQAMETQRARDTATSVQPVEADVSVASHLEEGDSQLEKGDRRLALLHYLEARRLSPNDGTPLMRIGYYYLPEDPERSAAIFASLIENDANFAPAHAGLGLARFAQGRYTEARAAFERAVEIDADMPDALDVLGILHAIDDDPQTGLEYAQRAFQVNAHDAQIVNNLGVAYLRAAEYARAEESFRAAILLDPSDPAVYNNLGYSLGRQGRYAEATAAFRRFGDASAVHNNLGYVYYLNGDTEAAVRHFEIAVRTVDPDTRLQVLQNLRAATRRHAAVSP
jgi:superkiller protein 3